MGVFVTPSQYRNVVLADRIRAQLLDIYGNRCSQCGASNGEAHLEVNHIYGRDWKPNNICRYRRFLRYRREAQQGLINLLCPECNGSYRPKAAAKPTEPCKLFKAWLVESRPF